MTYNYLFDLYRVLAERQADILNKGVHPTTSSEEQYRQGRIETIHDFQVFLKDNYHGKLPRRLR